jgi:zinc transporter ZupT
MLEAFGWGLLAQSSLLIAGLLVCWVTVPTKVVGILGGFGAGAMIAAVSLRPASEALADIEPWQTGLWMLAGVAVFLLADQLVERRFGSEGAGGAMGIIVGSDLSGAVQGDRAAALAAGGLLAMLTNSLIPFSFERGGSLAGAATAVGFCLSVMPS